LQQKRLYYFYNK